MWPVQLKSLSAKKPKKTVLDVQKATRERRKPSAGTVRRRGLEAAYKASYDEIEDTVKCAACGMLVSKTESERHHPAGRRKAAFLFTVQLCSKDHQRVHYDPKWATARGLLWSGRNSKVLSMADAITLVNSMPHPPLYALTILENHHALLRP